MEAVRICAERFRAALERCDRNLLPIALQDFPNGSCGDAALLLAKYLQKSGLGRFDYVCGTLYKDGELGFQSHAWLQREDVIVDITADQFDEVQEPVLITRDHSWHKHFEEKSRHVADYENYDPEARASFSAAYENVVACVHDN